MDRNQAVDILRGAVMIVMALDHVREFTHSAAASFAPEDLAHTTPAIFFTRWITHFCAPAFMFTAGLGAWFRLRRGRTRVDLSRFLLSRGLWLIFLEVTVLQFAFYFTFPFPLLILTILWAIGASMIALSLLIWLPVRLVTVLSVALIGLHNAFDGLRSDSPLWIVLHQGGMIRVAGLPVVVGYPLIPWIGVMALGYCFGRVYDFEPATRRHFMVRLGLALILGFLALRAWDGYGDPTPWSSQGSLVMTAVSFLNCAKYPPSLDFLLMTLGPAILALGLLDGVKLSKRNPFLVFGRTPFFYFVIHFFLAHGTAFALAFLRYGTEGLRHPPAAMGARTLTPQYGFDLWVSYLVWAAVVLTMYPLCRWFAGVKERRHDWWLSYL